MLWSDQLAATSSVQESRGRRAPCTVTRSQLDKKDQERGIRMARGQRASTPGVMLARLVTATAGKSALPVMIPQDIVKWMRLASPASMKGRAMKRQAFKVTEVRGTLLRGQAPALKVKGNSKTLGDRNTWLENMLASCHLAGLSRGAAPMEWLKQKLRG